MKLKDRLIGILQLFICVAIPGTIYSSFKFSGHPLSGLETLVLYAPFVYFYIRAEFKRKQLKSFQASKSESIPITPEMLAAVASDDAPESEEPVTREERLKDIDTCLQKAISDCAQGKISAKEFADICALLRQAENEPNISTQETDNSSQQAPSEEIYPIENDNELRAQTPANRFVGHNTADLDMLHISPDIYTQTVREELNLNPYNPEYHKGARNPYTNATVTCEDDYIEYVKSFVLERLTAEKRTADHSVLDQKSQKNSPTSVEKPIGCIPNSSYVPIPWWRNTRILAYLALGLIAATLICAVIFAIMPRLPNPMTGDSPPPVASTTPPALIPLIDPSQNGESVLKQAIDESRTQKTKSSDSSPLPSESLSVQERLDLMKQNENDNNKPLPRPHNGWVAYSTHYYGERIAPLTINTSSLTSDFYIKLRRPDTKAEVVSFYIYGNTQKTVYVPLGSFEILYASGSNWYGATNLFGPETSYCLFDELFDFYEENGYINGWTITLEMRYDGNLDTDQISADEFFGS